MSDATTELFLADYEHLETRYLHMCDLASHVALCLSEEQLEYLLTVQLPLHFEQTIVADFVAAMSNNVADDEQAERWVA